MPTGAVISPPDSSDDDLPEVRGRKLENLKELQAAISQIPQRKAVSPPKSGVHASHAGDLLVSPDQASAIAEDDTDEDIRRKPQMVRKKSGELVRPALRPPSRRRPSSMPGTPTFSKAVHFDSHLEHVRHFLQVDRPLAVSAGSSPVDNYDSDAEYPFNAFDRSASVSPPFEWEINTSNFPSDTPARKALPVRLERVWLTNDQKSLIGSVAVANLAFQKSVTCRFTLDYWKTTSEVVGEYMTTIGPAEGGSVSYDRFTFTIKLSDMANLESKTLYFCVRYNVSGQEHWDNNGGTNFQIDFRKKMLPLNGKKAANGAGSRLANGLPKSTRRPSAAAPKPKSTPLRGDDFTDKPKVNFDQSLHDYLDEPEPAGPRLKGVKSSSSIPSDNLSRGLAPPSGQAFANRYDFGASLSAAIQTAKDSGKSDGLYMKSFKKPSVVPILNKPKETNGQKDSAVNTKLPPVVTQAPALPSLESPGGSISSSSYEELVNKYCFFGSKQTSPPVYEGTLRGGRYDGADDVPKIINTSGLSSYEGSPVQMGNYRHSHSGVQHHSLHPKDPNPYFQHGTRQWLANPAPETSLPAYASHMASASSQVTDRSSSPAGLVGNFAPFTIIRG